MRTLAPSVVFLVLMPIITWGGDSAEEEQRKLQGFWLVVQSIGGGKEEPQEGEDRTLLVFDGSIIQLREGRKEPVDFVKYKLNPAKSPKEMDLRYLFGANKGATRQAIYELEGKTLKICVQQDPEQPRPKEFVSPKDSKILLIVMKRP